MQRLSRRAKWRGKLHPQSFLGRAIEVGDPDRVIALKRDATARGRRDCRLGDEYSEQGCAKLHRGYSALFVTATPV